MREKGARDDGKHGNQQRSPLANTLRFTLGFNFDKSKKKKQEAE